MLGDRHYVLRAGILEHLCPLRRVEMFCAEKWDQIPYNPLGILLCWFLRCKVIPWKFL